MPTFDEKKRLSQLPEFVMQDSGPGRYVCGESVRTEQLLAEGAQYTKLFLDDVQNVYANFDIPESVFDGLSETE